MITITKLYARSFDLDRMDLFWELEDFKGNILQYDFYVLRSEVEFGEYETLAGPFQDEYHFRDIKPQLLNRMRRFFYKIKVVDRLTNETKEFGPTGNQAEPDLIALEINRQEDMLMREFVGRRCWVFPIRTFGAKCICFDPTLGRRTKTNCINCYGTGYLGGFHKPVECFIQFDPNPAQNRLTPQMEQHPDVATARLISYPQIGLKDIIVETENIRWRAIKVTSTQRLRSVVHQEIVCDRIEQGDIEFRLPVNIADLMSIVPAGERNFTNPHHVDNEPDVKNILAVYGYNPRGTV